MGTIGKWPQSKAFEANFVFSTFIGVETAALTFRTKQSEVVTVAISVTANNSSTISF